MPGKCICVRIRRENHLIIFPLVFIQVYDMDSSGHFQDHAHLDCLSFLLERNKKWKHVLLLQVFNFILENIFTFRTTTLSSNRRRNWAKSASCSMKPMQSEFSLLMRPGAVAQLNSFWTKFSDTTRMPIGLQEAWNSGRMVTYFVNGFVKQYY